MDLGSQLQLLPTQEWVYWNDFHLHSSSQGCTWCLFVVIRSWFVAGCTVFGGSSARLAWRFTAVRQSTLCWWDFPPTTCLTVFFSEGVAVTTRSGGGFLGCPAVFLYFELYEIIRGAVRRSVIPEDRQVQCCDRRLFAHYLGIYGILGIPFFLFKTTVN